MAAYAPASSSALSNGQLSPIPIFPGTPSHATPGKPIRATFKTIDGRYRLIHELVATQPPLLRRFGNSLKPSKISVVSCTAVPRCGSELLLSHKKTNKKLSSSKANSKIPMELIPQELHHKARSVSSSQQHSMYVSVNSEDTVLIYDIATDDDPIHCLAFKATPTCHDINQFTATTKSFEALIGFSSGDIILHSPPTNEDLSSTITLHFNKDGHQIDERGVTALKWVPNHPSFFLASFESGNIYLFDTSKSSESPITHLQPAVPLSASSLSKESAPSSSHDPFSIGGSFSHKSSPLLKWHVSNSHINDIAFSADGKFVAIASRDGFIRIVDFQTSRPIIRFRSYYGAFLTVSWSPDGKFVAAGGEDDSISVFDIKNKCLSARGVGHTSWVSAVAFDYTMCRLDDGYYRILSADHDCRLLLWDFSSNDSPSSGSASSSSALAAALPPASSASSPASPYSFDATGFITIPSLSLPDMPTFEPIASHRAHLQPLTSLAVTDNALVTVCCDAVVKLWRQAPSSAATARILSFLGETPPRVKLDNDEDDDDVQSSDVHVHADPSEPVTPARVKTRSSRHGR